MKLIFYKKYWWLLAIIFLMMLVSVCAITASSYLTTPAISYLQVGDYNNFYLFIGITIICFILSLVIGYFNSILKEIYLQKINNRLRNTFVANLDNKNFEFIKKNNAGVVHNWINNDILNIYNKVTSLLFEIIELTLLLITTLIALILLYWGIALIVLFLGVVLLLVPLLFNKKLQKIGTKFGEDNEKYFTKIYKNVQGFRNLFFLNALSLLVKKIKKDSQDFKDDKISFINNNTKVTWILILVSILGQTLTTMFGALFAAIKPDGVNALFPISGLLSLIFLTGSFFGSFQGLFQGVMGFFAGKGLIRKNIIAKEDYHYEINSNLDDLKVWKLENISLTYGENQILKNINFKFEKNKKYLIIGESGSGKSSIAKMLVGINKDFKGKIFWNDSEINKINHELLNAKTSYVTNTCHLFDASFKDNISLFEANIDKEKLDKSISESNIDFASDLNKEISQSEFSTGQIQRINIARSIYEDKKVVIFDEALSNLDKKNAFDIEKRMLQKQDLTFIHITHHYDEKNFKLYDCVLRIKDKEISYA
ncbi:MAG: ABC transporter ATP-binding protein [Malacoplasma sp.]|nr:ABC transporter ATP-binding protein [Malacoplasma sp.]